MYNRIKNIKTEKMFKPYDLVVAALFLTVCIFSVAMFLKPQGEKVRIYVDNSLYGSYSLSTNAEIDINGKNVVVIENGQVYMKQADCKAQYCVRHKPISRAGEQIICLPNKVVVAIEGGREDFDATT